MRKQRHQATAEGAPHRSPSSAPLGHTVGVAGHELFVHRSGAGAPAVVFLPGAGAVGLDYWYIQDTVGGFTTSLVYDRAGTGWSARVPLPRCSTEVTDELHELLQVIDVPAPYIFVGHSLGGLYGRHFAQRFPDETAGLVLLDPAHEEMRAYMPKELVEQWEAWDPDQVLPDELPQEVVDFYRGLFARELDTWPAEVRDPLIEAHISPGWIRTGIEEAKNIEDLYKEVGQAAPWPDVPTIILSSMEADEFKRAVSASQSEELLQAEIEGKKRLYDALAASMARAESRPVDAGHVTLPLRHPEAVVQAVCDVIARHLT